MRIGAWRPGEKPAGGSLRQRRRDPAQGLPDFALKFEAWAGRREREMLPLGPGGCGAYRSFRMKLFTGSLAAGLVLLAGSAQAQVPGPYENGRPRYTAASDFGAPYARPVPGPRYGDGPSLLPSLEVYSVLRDNGFSPLGIPRLRGFVYTIAVIDHGGADGRLVIDARNGRIIRFVPARGMGDNYYEDQSALGGPSAAPPPQAQVEGSAPPSRPAAHVATRTVPMPKAKPLAAKPAPVPAPIQQAAAPAPKPAEVQAAAPVTTGSASAKPAPQIAPTQDMPTMQGLE